MTEHHNLSETVGANTAARYYDNGKRISRAEYDRIRDRAYREGRVDCLSTKARQVGDTFRRTNYLCASY